MDDWRIMMDELEGLAAEGLTAGEKACQTETCMWLNCIHAGECY